MITSPIPTGITSSTKRTSGRRAPPVSCSRTSTSGSSSCVPPASTSRPSATKYLALKATADFAGLVGIDDFKLSASDITVEYNAVKNSRNSLDTTVVDFSAFNNGNGYSIDTGNGALNLDYDRKRLLVRLGEADLQIGSYVFVHGSFAFEKVADLNNVALTPGGSEKNFSAVNIGAEGVTMFFGVDGPYIAESARSITTPSASRSTTRKSRLRCSLRSPRQTRTAISGSRLRRLM